MEKIKDLIAMTDEMEKDFMDDGTRSIEENKRYVAQIIAENINDGTYGAIEGIVMLSALDCLDPENLEMEGVEINTMAYPQFKTVDRAMNRRLFDVPMACLLLDFVIDDFLVSYCKGSISFEELIYRLVAMGRIPYGDYLRATPKERRERGKDVAMYHLF